jgi:hypothetical protein
VPLSATFQQLTVGSPFVKVLRQYRMMNRRATLRQTKTLHPRSVLADPALLNYGLDFHIEDAGFRSGCEHAQAQ